MRSRIALALIFFLLLGPGGALASDSEETLWQNHLTVEYIAEQLASRVEDVQDITASVTYVTVSARDGSKTEGELKLSSIFPDLVRVTWVKPDLLSGILWIADMELGRFTQYQPATGEAMHQPLDSILGDMKAQIPLTPEDLFSLPSSEQYDLDVTDLVTQDDGASWAVVRAVDNQTGQTFRVWVDLNDWLVTQVERLTPEGRVEVTAKAHSIQLNQGLTAAQLRRLPNGTRVLP